MTLLLDVRGKLALKMTLSTLKSGFKLLRMAAWHSAFRRCSRGPSPPPEPPLSRNTRNSTSSSGPPPGAGTPTAAASATASTALTHTRSKSTELTCTAARATRAGHRGLETSRGTLELETAH